MAEPLDELEKFKLWWMTERKILPPAEPMNRINEAVAGTVLFRSGRFQVELMICEGNSEIKDHRHPGMDSFEVYVSGDVYFRHKGQQVVSAANIAQLASGTALRVRPEDWHGASIGPRGGVFLSLQRWSAAPSSVYVNWEGQANNAVAGARREKVLQAAVMSKDEMLGLMLRLAAGASGPHKDYRGAALLSNFTAPIALNQVVFLPNKLGFFTWAWLGEVERKAWLRSKFLPPGHWKSGEELWAMDFVAPFGHSRELVKLARKIIPAGLTARWQRSQRGGKLGFLLGNGEAHA